MERYQIRLPENMTLEEFVGDLTVKAWMMINRNFDFSRQPYEFYPEFQNTIITVLMEHIKAFDLCGADEICKKGIDSTPLSYETKIRALADDCICHLFIEYDLEEFLEELAFRSLQSIKQILKSSATIKVFQTLQMVYRSVFADYLYSNPSCGRAKICDSSEEIKAWGRLSRTMIQ